jgi:hypothetical protein
MTVGNVISLTPTHPGLPGRFDWSGARLPVNAQDSSSTDSDEPEPGSKKGRCSRSSTRRETSGASMWKPVVLTIACLNIIALGGLVYSAPWTPKAEQEQTSSPSMRHQVQRKLLIPLEASVTTDGKVLTRYPRDFLSSVPPVVRRSLLDSLREDASDEARRTADPSEHPRQGAGTAAPRASNVSRESIEYGRRGTRASS